MHETTDSRRLSTSKISTRFRFFFAAVSTTALALAGTSFAVGGCAADLQKDPSEYTNVVEEGGGAQLPCNLNMLMTQSCWGIGCHGSNTPAAGLDLESTGVEGRVLNQPATHRDILNGSQVNCGCSEGMGSPPVYTCPTSTQLLVDGNNPDNSLILKKVNGTHACGDKMPVPPRTIDSSGIACLRAWVFQIAGKDPNSSTPPPMGGSGGTPAAGGGGAGGTGGTAGSSGSTGAGGTGGASAGTGGGGTGGI